MNKTRRHALVAGLTIIFATNGVVLTGVALNRSGVPDSTLQLSERELRPSYYKLDRKENSGLALTLQWRVLDGLDGSQFWRWASAGQGGEPDWLNKEKMSALGFDTTLADTRYEASRRHHRDDTTPAFQKQLPRDVLLVLEFDGATYQESLRRAKAAPLRDEVRVNSTDLERASKNAVAEENAHSRLFVVDAGLDAAALRARFPDRARYAIVGGQVRPGWGHSKPARTHTGRVDAVNVDEINVPLDLRPVFAGAAPLHAETSGNATRYQLTLAIGQRHEPWIVSAERKSP